MPNLLGKMMEPDKSGNYNAGVSLINQATTELQRRRGGEVRRLAMVLDWAYKYGADVRSNDIGAVKKEGFEYAVL